jgi:hypothetical protein
MTKRVFFITNGVLATLPIFIWFYFLKAWRHSSWEGNLAYFLLALFVLLIIGFVGILRATKAYRLASRLLLASSWLFILIPIFLFLTFFSAIDGLTVMP